MTVYLSVAIAFAASGWIAAFILIIYANILCGRYFDLRDRHADTLRDILDVARGWTQPRYKHQSDALSLIATLADKELRDAAS